MGEVKTYKIYSEEIMAEPPLGKKGVPGQLALSILKRKGAPVSVEKGLLCPENGFFYPTPGYYWTSTKSEMTQTISFHVSKEPFS